MPFNCGSMGRTMALRRKKHMFVDLFLSFHLQFILPFLLTLSPFAQSISFLSFVPFIIQWSTGLIFVIIPLFILTLSSSHRITDLLSRHPLKRKK